MIGVLASRFEPAAIACSVSSLATRGEPTPLSITVEIAEPLGDEVVVHARAGEEPLVFKQDPHRPVASGDTFEVQVELDALHLFDAGTERRIGA